MGGPTWVALVGTLTLWMRLVGAVASGWMADRMGRRAPLMISILWYSICNFIEQFTKGFDAKTFADNDQVIFAVKYALMIISEATTKLGDTAADFRPVIPWREIRGLGNRLQHDYDTQLICAASGC